jgi:hypothetical protein
MAGRWSELEGGRALAFVPRFPFLPATSYTVVPVSGDGAPVEIVAPPVGGPASTRVVSIDPSGPVVPRNLLRIYITFSAPMSEGRASRHLRVERDDSGEVLEHVLLPLDPELWDPGRRRLTVLLDPARIKRGLAPHREAGYPLETGRAVRLVVDAALSDAAGRPLQEGAVAVFAVGTDLRGRVRPERWQLEPPRAGARDALVVRFDRPLDRPLTERCVTVAGVTGRGRAALDGRSWSFVPDAPWALGTVVVTVDPILEDIAGNSVARVFDRDLSIPDDDPLEPVRAVPLEVALRPASAP